jgi:hypothetical protein
MREIERRLIKLEAASGHKARALVIFVSLVPRDPASPGTATVGDRVWRQRPDELDEETFLARVAAEARQTRPGNEVLLAFLD